MNTRFRTFGAFLKLASSVGLAILLGDGAMTAALASDAVTNDLSISQTFEKSRQAYASLASYSDEGQVVTTMSGVTNMITFATRLARPIFYKFEWQRIRDSSDAAHPARIQAVWYSGAGNFLYAEWGTQKQYNQEIALLKAAELSGGAATTIPMTFFHIRSRDTLGDSGFGAHRQADEKVGGVDCYVITQESRGETKTLWIGKQDFLVRQVRTVVSAEAMRAAVAQWNPEIMSSLHGFTSTETHTNIVLNKPFSRTDFAPAYPTYPWLDSE